MSVDSRWLTVVFLLSLALRLVFVIGNWDHPALFTEYDSWGYHQIAVNLMEGHGYCWEEKPPYEVNIYRPPGYPVMLTVLYSIFGASIPAGIVLQAFVGSLTVLLTYQMALAAFDRRVARLASFLMAVDPISVIYSNLLLTETFSAFVISLCGVLAVGYVQQQRTGYLFGLGICFALGIITHPILILLPGLLVLLPAINPETRVRKHFMAAALALIIAWLPAVAWMGRNYQVADYFGISSVSSVNLMKYKAAGVLAKVNGTSRHTEGRRLAKEIEETLPENCTRGERFSAWKKRSIEVLLQYPLVYCKLHVRGMIQELCGTGRDRLRQLLYGARTLGPEGRVTDDQIYAVLREEGDPVRNLIVLGATGFHLVALLVVAGGAVSLLVHQRYFVFFAVALVPLYVLNLSGGPEASSRFRVIFVPCLALFFAFGVKVILESLRKRENLPVS